MQNTAQEIKFTYQDYLLTPEDKRYELIEGDLFMTPAPDWFHQGIAVKLFRVLDSFVEKHKQGFVRFAPVDVILSEEDVVQPDILFISNENRGKIAKEGVRGAPDLVVEILSPATQQRDRVIKRKLYGRYGVRELWIVDPEAKTVELVGWEGTGPRGSDFKTLKTYPIDSTFASPLLETLTFQVKSIFEE